MTSIIVNLTSIVVISLCLFPVHAEGQASRAVVTVSLTFDDTLAEQAKAVDTLKKYGMHGTFYINSAKIGMDSGYFSRHDLLKMQKCGHEIAGHTLHHRHELNRDSQEKLKKEDIQREICSDKRILTNMDFRVANLAYPYGNFDGDIYDVAKECYSKGIARTTTGLSDRNPAETIPPKDWYKISARSSVQYKTTVNMLIDYVKRAEASAEARKENNWVPLVFHRFSNEVPSDDSDARNRNLMYNITPDNFDKFLAWLKSESERDGGKVKVVVKTVQEVVGGTP